MSYEITSINTDLLDRMQILLRTGSTNASQSIKTKHIYNYIVNQITEAKHQRWLSEENDCQRRQDQVFQKDLLEEKITEARKLVRRLKARLTLSLSLLKLVSFDLDVYLSLYQVSQDPAVKGEIDRLLIVIQAALLEVEHLQRLIGKIEASIDKLYIILAKLGTACISAVQ